jgi:hypothetical protein
MLMTFAQTFGRLSDEEQAAILNAGADALRRACGASLDTQACSIAEHLTRGTVDVLRRLVEHYEEWERSDAGLTLEIDRKRRELRDLQASIDLARQEMGE